MAEFELALREAEKTDATDLIRFLNQVGAESDYMTLDEAGILMDEEQMAQFIQRQAERIISFISWPCLIMKSLGLSVSQRIFMSEFATLGKSLSLSKKPFGIKASVVSC